MPFLLAIVAHAIVGPVNLQVHLISSRMKKRSMITITFSVSFMKSPNSGLGLAPYKTLPRNDMQAQQRPVAGAEKENLLCSS